MRIAHVINTAGERDSVPAYTVNEFEWWNLVPEWHTCRTRKKTMISKWIATFDIETTTIRPDREDEPPYGYMYHWQLCIGLRKIYCIYGRTWAEFEECMDNLAHYLDTQENRHLIIYVHNLGYEFQFIRDFLKRTCGGFSLFAAQKRKPIKVTCGNGLEFRCSYKLTNMSLAKFLENEKGVAHVKAVEDLDYSKIRTPDTPLTDEEFGYCISDVLGLYEGIRARLANEADTVESIPLTSTGYVRRDCRNATRKNQKYFHEFQKMRLTPEVYTLLKETVRGGNTHANRAMSGRVWEAVDSFDVVSSYPAQMLLKYFPCTKFALYGYAESMEEFEQLLDKYCCLFRILFYNVRVNSAVTMPYIPVSKCIGHSGRIVNDNGRVLACEAVAMTLTEIDYEIIKEQYTWDSISLGEIWTAHRGALPEELRGQIMHYFTLKTELKGRIKKCKDAEEKENLKYLYAKSKNRLNGIFGMCLTDIVHPELYIDAETGEWKTTIPEIAESLDKYYNSRNNFLQYSWGVYVTAHARQHLQTLLNATGSGTIYCDTDSSKALGVDMAKIERLNAEIRAECERLGVYADYDGERYYLGEYERETKEPMRAFKTLGAKKYVDVDASGNLEITIAGVGKKAGAKELGSIDRFQIGFTFEEAGGTTLYYNDATIQTITVNGCTFETASNIGMVESTYKIGVTEEYLEILGCNLDDLC